MQGHNVSGCLLQDKINQKPGQAPPSWQIADAYVVTGWLLRSAMAFKIYSTRRMAKMIVTDYYKLIARNY